MAEEYTGEYWDFFTPSNCGFFMAPAEDRIFHVRCRNMYEGHLSADALGIAAFLCAYSNLSFSLSDVAREYVRQHYAC
jgi:hypothetical protein